MNDTTLSQEYIKELKAEAGATRKCLERIDLSLFDWKPHEKSMQLGYLAILVADIPKWIKSMIEDSVIDLATYPHSRPKNTEELVKDFDENMKGAVQALENVSSEALNEIFYLKNNGVELFSSPIKDNIGSSINHMIHHRGQLTVYMRLNDVAVPSIYGPSADDKGF